VAVIAHHAICDFIPQRNRAIKDHMVQPIALKILLIRMTFKPIWINASNAGMEEVLAYFVEIAVINL
jgi:hypothetical protein